MKRSSRKNRYIRSKAENRAGRPVRVRLAAVLYAMGSTAVILATGLACIFIYDWVTQSSYFRADTVEITGCERLDENAVREITGIREGVNVLSVNLSTARKRLVAEPWVADAGIRRDLPSRMVIRVREHEPAAIIDFGANIGGDHGGGVSRRFLLNESGDVFKACEDPEPSGMPVITGINYREWTADSGRGKRVSGAVLSVLDLCGRPAAALPKEAVEKIIVDKDIGLTLHVREPEKQITLGFGDYETKFGRLESVLARMEQAAPENDFSLVDLRNPNRIVAKPACENQVVAGIRRFK